MQRRKRILWPEGSSRLSNYLPSKKEEGEAKTYVIDPAFLAFFRLTVRVVHFLFHFFPPPSSFLPSFLPPFLSFFFFLLSFPLPKSIEANSIFARNGLVHRHLGCNDQESLLLLRKFYAFGRMFLTGRHIV